jgi:signal peptidase I
MSISPSNIKMYMPKGRSMYPFLMENNSLIAKKVSQDLLHVGDIIIFNNSNCYIVHRLIKKFKNGDGKLLFQAKGDANYFLDSPVTYEDIIGKVYLIEKDASNGARQLIDLDCGLQKVINYSLAKFGYFKMCCRNLLRFCYHLLR